MTAVQIIFAVQLLLVIIAYIMGSRQKQYKLFAEQYGQGFQLNFMAPASLFLIDKLNISEKMANQVQQIHEKIIRIYGSPGASGYTRMFMAQAVSAMLTIPVIITLLAMLGSGSISMVIFGFALAPLVAYLLFKDLDKRIKARNNELDRKSIEDNAVNNALKIFTGNGITSLLLGARNTLYINEYAVLYFDNHNRELSHKIKNEEVEYILYGQPYPGVSFAAACGEIYGVRFALRYLEGLYVLKAAAANPVALAIAAAAYAASMATWDLNRLVVEKKEVELASHPKALSKITLSYKDYLRLFLFMHTNSTKKLARMQTLTELNTGQDLAQIPVYVQGKVTTSIRLWFIPTVIKALKINGGAVQGNRFIIEREASMYY